MSTQQDSKWLEEREVKLEEKEARQQRRIERRKRHYMDDGFPEPIAARMAYEYFCG